MTDRSDSMTGEHSGETLALVLMLALTHRAIEEDMVRSGKEAFARHPCSGSRRLVS